MAVKTIFKSDVSDKEIENVEHVTVTIGNKSYVIDVDRDDLENELSQVSVWDTKVKGREADLRTPRRRRRSSGSSQPGLHSKVRAWAKEKGLEVSERGAVSRDLIEQYVAETRAVADAHKAEQNHSEDSVDDTQQES